MLALVTCPKHMSVYQLRRDELCIEPVFEDKLLVR